MTNQRRTGWKTENRFINNIKDTWWRGEVKRVPLSGGLKDWKGDVLLFEDGKYYQGECKKGKQVNIKKLLGWLKEDDSDFLALEPKGTHQQYIFMPVEVWKEMVGEWRFC